jgi:hypothetical protein
MTLNAPARTPSSEARMPGRTAAADPSDTGALWTSGLVVSASGRRSLISRPVTKGGGPAVGVTGGEGLFSGARDWCVAAGVVLWVAVAGAGALGMGLVVVVVVFVVAFAPPDDDWDDPCLWEGFDGPAWWWDLWPFDLCDWGGGGGGVPLPVVCPFCGPVGEVAPVVVPFPGCGFAPVLVGGGPLEVLTWIVVGGAVPTAPAASVTSRPMGNMPPLLNVTCGAAAVDCGATLSKSHV